VVGHKSGAILRQMQALLDAGTFSGLSDQQLLERFLERRDEGAELAFAVLVERHGPMVLGVCRRIMRDLHDAEDAFQATFLVLARKGPTIRVEGSLGRWLFGVATRVATRARDDERRRRARERSGLNRLDGVGTETSPADIDRAELQATIAREIAGLPARFQAPVLLCDLEGTSYEEAARRLGWPVGTVKSRLSRARARLRERLTRRGLAAADLSIVTALLPTAPPSSLVEATTRAALALISGRMMSAGVVSASVATLTQGVLRTMTITRFTIVAAALLLIATGSAALFGQAAAPKAAGGGVGLTPASAAAKTGAAPANDDRIDLEMLERAWTDALNRRDAAVVGRILADDFEGIDPSGSTFTKASYLVHLKNGGLASGVALDAVKVRLFDDTGVVVSELKSSPSPRYERATKVYVKLRGRWQCVASHADRFHGAAFSADAKAEWKKAMDEWRTFAAPAKNDCIACHTTNVHADSLFRRAGEATSSIPLGRMAIVSTPFDCRVEKVHVTVGQAVKQGDPLIELFSSDLAAAKSEYEAAASQWRRDKSAYDEKKRLASFNTVSKQDVMDAENDETQSRLKMRRSRDTLLDYGLSEADIAHLGIEEDRARPRFTLRSPVDGALVVLDAVPGNFYNRKDVLIKIGAVPARDDRKP
jgi:RNA polymerase sigma factor (sigma-70 family)